MKLLRPLAELLLAIGLAFGIHYAILATFFDGRLSGFHYSLLELYGFFFACALLILLLLVRMKRNNIDSVGNTFMLLTVIQMILAYFMLRPVLSTTHAESALEKTNFFFVFAVFLTVETVIGIRLLNRET